MKFDIVVGALGEIAVQAFIGSLGWQCHDPDFSIHHERDKSFAADLLSEVGHVHVKSQSLVSASKYGSSWLFQKEDKLFTLPSERAHVAFCIVDGTTVYVKCIVKNIDLAESGLQKQPKVFKYQHSKVALYLDDILNSNLDLRSIKCK